MRPDQTGCREREREREKKKENESHFGRERVRAAASIVNIDVKKHRIKIRDERSIVPTATAYMKKTCVTGKKPG